MISLRKNSIKTFNKVQNPVIDWITLGSNVDNLNGRTLTHEERVLKNTSGTLDGGREKVEKLIAAERLKNPALAKLDVEELFIRVVDNISKDKTYYDPKVTPSLELFCIQRVKNALRSIIKDLTTKEVQTVRFEDESDSDGDEDFRPTTEYQMYKSGLLDEIELEMTEDEARDLFLRALRSFNLFEKKLGTDQTRVPSILLMQTKYAQETLPGINKKVTNINVSLGLQPNANVKNNIDYALTLDAQGPRNYYNAVLDMWKAISVLKIPFSELTPDLTTDEMIRKLTLAREHAKTIAVTEYDYPILPNLLPREEVNYKYVTKDLKKDYVRNITNSLVEEIYRVKLSDFRRLDTITKTIRTYVDEMQISPELVIDANPHVRQTKYTIKEDLLDSSQLMNIGRHADEKLIVESDTYGGPLSSVALSLIKNNVARYMLELELGSPDHFKKLKKAVELLMDEYDLGVAANGFLCEKVYDEEGTKLTSSGVMAKYDLEEKKWSPGKYFTRRISNESYLVHRSGYMIKNYIRYIYEKSDRNSTTLKGNVGEGEEKFVWRKSPDVRDFSVLEVYDLLNLNRIYPKAGRR